jgi:broad specificity phosphatase PhoE
VSTTFLLVRHAAHDWLGRGLAGRLPGVELNAAGQQQAQELVARLQQVPLDAIYCSPQPRTRQTAQPLAAARELPIHVHADFDEVDFGEWMGRSFDELSADREVWAQWVDRRGSARPPGGEAFEQVPRRALSGLHRLRAEHPGRHVAVFSHGDVIKAVVASCLGMSLDHLERFEITPASVTVLALGADWSQLKLLNAQAALA